MRKILMWCPWCDRPYLSRWSMFWHALPHIWCRDRVREER